MDYKKIITQVLRDKSTRLSPRVVGHLQEAIIYLDRGQTLRAKNMLGRAMNVRFEGLSMGQLQLLQKVYREL